MDGLKLLVIFIVILYALYRKFSVGVTMLFAAVLTALLYQVEFPRLVQAMKILVLSGDLLLLTAIVILVTILGALLKDLGYLQRLSHACQGLYGGKRTAVTILPPLVGLMPMPGGSLLSAPLVENVLADGNYLPEFKVSANYWFRHMVEFSWPIYPGIILAHAITGMSIGQIALLQLPLAIIMLVLGLICFTRKIEPSKNRPVSLPITIVGILEAIWPIGLAMALFGVFGVNLSLALVVSIVSVLLINRPSRKSTTASFRSGFSYSLVLLIFGILTFQMVLDLSGAVGSIPALAQRYALPSELVIFLVCFTIGLLTSMSSGVVGLGYILLAGFLYDPILSPSSILLAYLSGYIGMMLSPTHLCLVLTTDYFKANLGAVYRTIIPPLLLLSGLGFLLYLSPWGRIINSYVVVIK
ncbi:MAG: DUF401 family protein [candidate division Zixibacteria bacterium]|nr:DUF401 family protein [candidate division Zixibacteria bacterium]